MIILGIIILIVGFLLKIAILWTIGIIILVIGLILLLLGALGHAVGGRRNYWEPRSTVSRVRRDLGAWRLAEARPAVGEPALSRAPTA
jgi:hypothetical protein